MTEPPAASLTAPTRTLTPQQVEENFTLLRRMKLWDQASEEALRALAAVAHPESYDQHFRLFEDGDAGNKIYFLCSGAVEIYLTNAVDTHISLEVIEGEGFFGEVATLEGKDRTATARATRYMVTLEVYRADLLQVLHAHPDLMIAMYQQTARRLGRTSINLRKTNIRNPNDLIPDPTETQQWTHKLARFCGSRTILFVNAALIGLYCLGWALAHRNPLDGVPFNGMALFLGLEAIAITCIVLNSQYRQEENDRTRNQEQFQADINSERAILNLDERVRALSSELGRRLPALKPSEAPSAERRPCMTTPPDLPRGHLRTAWRRTTSFARRQRPFALVRKRCPGAGSVIGGKRAGRR